MIEGIDVTAPGRRRRRGPTADRHRVPVVQPVPAHDACSRNVTLAPRKVLRLSERARRTRARDELLERFGLDDKADEYPDRLSGGQQQRVAIVRALAMQPDILLLDEVTSALDPVLVAEVLDAIRELAAQGMTMVIATHEMGFARDVANRVVLPARGRDRRGRGPRSGCSPSRRRRRPGGSSTGSSPPGGCEPNRRRGPRRTLPGCAVPGGSGSTFALCRRRHAVRDPDCGRRDRSRRRCVGRRTPRARRRPTPTAGPPSCPTTGRSASPAPPTPRRRSCRRRSAPPRRRRSPPAPTGHLARPPGPGSTTSRRSTGQGRAAPTARRPARRRGDLPRRRGSPGLRPGDHRSSRPPTTCVCSRPAAGCSRWWVRRPRVRRRWPDATAVRRLVRPRANDVGRPA